nr:hypothetical protein [Burkholderia cenocepacia]
MRTLTSHSSARAADQKRDLSDASSKSCGSMRRASPSTRSRQAQPQQEDDQHAEGARDGKLGIEKDIDLLRYAIEHGIVAASASEGRGGDTKEEGSVDPA